jgi:hypothetical protein
MARFGSNVFFNRRRYKQQQLLSYIHREHAKGRHLTEILEDDYVKRSGSRTFVWDTLRDTPLLELLDEDVRNSFQRESADSPNQA